MKWIAASLGVLLAGILGTLTIAHTQAQEAETVDVVQAEPNETLRRVAQRDAERAEHERARLAELRSTFTSNQARIAPAQLFQVHGQPGTWQIVTAREMVLLLNSSTGATFLLEHQEGQARWKAIEGQFPSATAPKYVSPPRAETPDSARRVPLPPEVDKPARPDRFDDIKELEDTLRSLDTLIGSFERKLKRGVDSDEARKELEGTLKELRTERENVAKELEKARAEKRGDIDPPRRR